MISGISYPRCYRPVRTWLLNLAMHWKQLPRLEFARRNYRSSRKVVEPPGIYNLRVNGGQAEYWHFTKRAWHSAWCRLQECSISSRGGGGWGVGKPASLIGIVPANSPLAILTSRWCHQISCRKESCITLNIWLSVLWLFTIPLIHARCCEAFTLYCAPALGLGQMQTLARILFASYGKGRLNSSKQNKTLWKHKCSVRYDSLWLAVLRRWVFDDEMQGLNSMMLNYLFFPSTFSTTTSSYRHLNNNRLWYCFWLHISIAVLSLHGNRDIVSWSTATFIVAFMSTPWI